MNRKIAFKEIVDRANQIIERYERIEGKAWKAQGIVIELSKQVGELSKLIMVKEGYYFPDRVLIDKGYEVSDEKIADELADIFRCILRLARHYKLDLLEADEKACKEDDKLLKSKGV